jgi:hypothetical protein
MCVFCVVCVSVPCGALGLAQPHCQPIPSQRHAARDRSTGRTHRAQRQTRTGAGRHECALRAVGTAVSVPCVSDHCARPPLSVQSVPSRRGVHGGAVGQTESTGTGTGATGGHRVLGGQTPNDVWHTRPVPRRDLWARVEGGGRKPTPSVTPGWGNHAPAATAGWGGSAPALNHSVVFPFCPQFGSFSPLPLPPLPPPCCGTDTRKLPNGVGSTTVRPMHRTIHRQCHKGGSRTSTGAARPPTFRVGHFHCSTAANHPLCFSFRFCVLFCLFLCCFPAEASPRVPGQHHLPLLRRLQLYPTVMPR